MTIGGTAAYEAEMELPGLVRDAVALARSLDFGYSCLPSQGRLLQVLARGCRGGLIGETGTGCGVGLAWMVSAVDASTRLISVEVDPARAAATQALFRRHSNVTVLAGDWHAIAAHGPFDLLVLDGGGTGKKAEVDPQPADPHEMLLPAGTVVIDDFTPCEEWPPTIDGEVDRVRLHWLEHPALRATEVRLTPSMSTVIARRR